MIIFTHSTTIPQGVAFAVLILEPLIFLPGSTNNGGDDEAWDDWQDIELASSAPNDSSEYGGSGIPSLRVQADNMAAFCGTDAVLAASDYAPVPAPAAALSLSTTALGKAPPVTTQHIQMKSLSRPSTRKEPMNQPVEKPKEIDLFSVRRISQWCHDLLTFSCREWI